MSKRKRKRNSERNIHACLLACLDFAFDLTKSDGFLVRLFLFGCIFQQQQQQQQQ